MRVIARTERPHPGAQLRITDADGLRVTAFATNSTRGQLPHLELRHRRRARAEDRIRCAKDTGLTNLTSCKYPLMSWLPEQPGGRSVSLHRGERRIRGDKLGSRAR
jgi:hypothetical protein